MKRNVMKQGFTIAAIVYVVTHFLALLWEHPILNYILSVSGLFALVFALLNLKARATILPLFLIGSALTISIFDVNTAVHSVLLEGTRAMRSLISMLLVIPIVGWVLKQENYVEDTLILLKRQLKNSKVLYFVLISLTQLISFFLLFGSIAVVYQMIQTFFAKQDSPPWKRLKASAVLRGFALTTVWVISIPSFAFSVEVMNASLVPTFLQGFIIALAGVFLSVLYLHIYEKQQRLSLSSDIESAITDALQNVKKQANLYRNPLEFLFLFISLLA